MKIKIYDYHKTEKDILEKYQHAISKPIYHDSIIPDINSIKYYFTSEYETDGGILCYVKGDANLNLNHDNKKIDMSCAYMYIFQFEDSLFEDFIFMYGPRLVVMPKLIYCKKNWKMNYILFDTSSKISYGSFWRKKCNHLLNVK